MKKLSGFTLLELLVVVVIVGILASLAIPKYIKSTENSRAAEAYNNLNAIRQAVWAYNAKYNVTDFRLINFDDLSIENPNDLNGAFSYSISERRAPFVIYATRKDGPYKNDFIVMDANGNLDETNWLK